MRNSVINTVSLFDLYQNLLLRLGLPLKRAKEMIIRVQFFIDLGNEKY